MYIQQSKQSIHDKATSQQGFTLIELMVSLVLGSLIAAAAFQVFYISQRTSTTQRSASSVQDSAVFGLNLLEKHLKLTNLNYKGNSEMNNATEDSGIILTEDNAKTAGLTDTDMFTKQGVSAASSFTAQSSDQLTIQFAIPPGGLIDCEGTQLATGQLVQRYYLHNGGLYCDSNLTGNFGETNGAEIISNVDQFRVLLITENGFKTPDNYNGVDPIRGVKLGFVFSGGTPTIESQEAAPKLFGQQLVLASDATNTVRRTYEPTILFRNARSL